MNTKSYFILMIIACIIHTLLDIGHIGLTYGLISGVYISTNVGTTS